MTSPENQKPKTKHKCYKCFLSFCERNKNIIQFTLMIIGIGTLGAYIYISQTQINQTHYSLWLADSTLKHTIKFDSLRYIEDTTDRGITRRSNEWSDKMRIKDTLAKDRIAKMELRAYLTITKFRPPVILRNYFKWVIEIMNTGKTPAYQTIGITGFKIGSKHLQALVDDISQDKNFNQSIGFLQANEMGDTLNFEISKPNITTNEFNGIYKSIDTMFVFIFIRYRDVFNNIHHTRCCYSIIGEGGSIISSQKYKDYNDGD